MMWLDGWRRPPWIRTCLWCGRKLSLWASWRQKRNCPDCTKWLKTVEFKVRRRSHG